MLAVTCCRAVEPTWCSFCARRLIPRLANRFDKISDVQIKLLFFFKFGSFFVFLFTEGLTYAAICYVRIKFGLDVHFSGQYR